MVGGWAKVRAGEGGGHEGGKQDNLKEEKVKDK